MNGGCRASIVRADTHARWAKIGRVLHRVLASGLLVAFLAGMLALIDSQVLRAQTWPWLATVYTVLGMLAAVGHCCIGGSP